MFLAVVVLVVTAVTAVVLVVNMAVEVAGQPVVLQEVAVAVAAVDMEVGKQAVVVGWGSLDKGQAALLKALLPTLLHKGDQEVQALSPLVSFPLVQTLQVKVAIFQELGVFMVEVVVDTLEITLPSEAQALSELFGPAQHAASHQLM
jgi:hypothetical protein